MLRFSWHMNVFPPLSLETWYMCVKTLRTGLVFPRWLIWGVTCLGLVEKFMFSHHCLWKYHKCVLKPSEQGSFFSETSNLRGHLPRFTLKMNTFPSISLETPERCVETLRTVLVFLRRLIWGVTCLGLHYKWMFSYLCLWKHDTCVLKPSQRGLFFLDNQFEVSHV